MITDIANMLVNLPYIWDIKMYPRKIHRVRESSNLSIVWLPCVTFIDFLFGLVGGGFFR